MSINRSELDYARVVDQTITGDIRLTTGQFTRRFLWSALVPLIVFIGLMIVSGYVRVWVAATFESDSLNLTTAISTSLLIIAVSWLVLSRLERRAHGWAALRRLLGVLGTLARLETALNSSESTLPVQADQAWSAYREYAEVIDHPLPPLSVG